MRSVVLRRPRGGLFVARPIGERASVRSLCSRGLLANRRIGALMADAPDAAPVPAPAPAAAAALRDRVRGALWGVFIADALSMPCHWYYSPDALARDFGAITGYAAPKARHPGSIMALSNTGGHGRGDQNGRIIGDVINHGKRERWGKPGVHYHEGMAAGENTLNAQCARVVMRSIAAEGGAYRAARFLSDYVAFMTTPGSHRDTYAESFHRDFFKNWAAGVPPERCAVGTEDHNTASVGGFVMLPPVVAQAVASGAGDGAAAEQALEHLRLTHESAKLEAYAATYARLLAAVLRGAPLRESAGELAAARRLDVAALTAPGWDDLRVVHRALGSACYIDDAFPVVLYFAYRYADDFQGGVLANTNVGGENCHRGSALGALLGAAAGESRLPAHLVSGLAESDAIRSEIDAFCDAVFPR